MSELRLEAQRLGIPPVKTKAAYIHRIQEKRREIANAAMNAGESSSGESSSEEEDVVVDSPLKSRLSNNKAELHNTQTLNDTTPIPDNLTTDRLATPLKAATAEAPPAVSGNPPIWAIVLIALVLILSIAGAYFGEGDNTNIGGVSAKTRRNDEFWPLRKSVIEKLHKELDGDVRDGIVKALKTHTGQRPATILLAGPIERGTKIAHQLATTIYFGDKNKERFQYLQKRTIKEAEQQVFSQLSRHPHSIIAFDTTSLNEETILFLSAIFDETMPQLSFQGKTVSTANAVFVLLSDKPTTSIREHWPHRLCQRIRTMVDFK
jgi:hypothetical protein